MNNTKGRPRIGHYRTPGITIPDNLLPALQAKADKDGTTIAKALLRLAEDAIKEEEQ